MALTSKAHRLFYLACVLTLASLMAAPARADFFDDARRTFQTDIPHFFQDDIPCAFGGQPTSHTKTSCKSPDHPEQHVMDKDRDRTAVPSDRTPELQGVPPSSNRY
jgi:hypothetical protein